MFSPYPRFLCIVSDIYVIIGARYDVSSGKWIWSDGTVAPFNDTSYTDCKQKAWHYGLDWELKNLDCSGTVARYSCQVEGE